MYHPYVAINPAVSCHGNACWKADGRTSLAGVAAVLIYPWLKRIGMIQPQLSACSETHQVNHNEPESPGELGVAQAYRKAIQHLTFTPFNGATERETFTNVQSAVFRCPTLAKRGSSTTADSKLITVNTQ
jgi:hypothetical protein